MADRFSSLPIDLRIHIISFLPMDDAIKTSILSHQWRQISSSLPNLNFNFKSFYQKFTQRYSEFDLQSYARTYFMDYVDQLLHNRRDSCLKKANFMINLDSQTLTMEKVDEWIMCVVNHNVEELELQIVSYKLEDEFFTRSKLKKLGLVGLNLKLPKIMCFPLLKSMMLSNIVFYGDDLTEKLFSSCPILEELSIRDCRLISSRLIIASDSLRVLKIFIECDEPKKIEICAMNLREIEYRSNVLPTITSETIASVVSVNLLFNVDFLDESDRNLFDLHAKSIWMGLDGVTTLCLYHMLYIECLARNPDLLACLPTSCVGIKLLGLVICPTDQNIQVFPFLRRAYPNVQHLKIYFAMGQSELMAKEKYQHMQDVERYQHSQEVFRDDELKHLKTVVIYSFQEHENQVGFVKYLLRKATILEKLEINYLYNHRWNLETTKMLLKLPKVSPHAQLLFPHM